MPDTNGASVSRTGMKDAEALEQIDQTTAAATQGNEAETARNGQVGQTDYAQQSMMACTERKAAAPESYR